MLVGSAERMAEARVWRKRYGAGMRQVGILAAAGLHALDHHLERLADDHARAARFAAACAEAAPASVDAATVETNIVVLDVGAVGWAAPEFVAALLEQGVRTYAVGPGRVRAVWHLDVDDAGTDAARRRRDRPARRAARRLSRPAGRRQIEPGGPVSRASDA